MRITRRASAPISATVAFALVGCGGGPSPSATPSATARPSAGAPASTAASPAPPPTGAFVQVAADELRVRSEPGTDGDVTGSLGRGAVVRIESGPTDADGFTWYEVVDTTSGRGWVAAGDDTDAWLQPAVDEADTSVILSFSYGCDVTGPVSYPATTITEGGRVIIGYGHAEGMIVGRLSETGLADVRENVIGSPYLQASAEYNAEPRPGAGDPPGHGACFYTFTLPSDADPVVVTAVSWFGDEEEAQFWLPSPERKSLTGLANNLMVIDELLDDDAWVEPPDRPYIATEYVLGIVPGEGPEPEGTSRVDSATLGLGDLDAYGGPTDMGGRCAVVPLAQAFEVVRVLNEGDGDGLRLDSLLFWPFGADDAWYSLTIVPRTPDGEPGCDALGG